MEEARVIAAEFCKLLAEMLVAFDEGRSQL